MLNSILLYAVLFTAHPVLSSSKVPLNVPFHPLRIDVFFDSSALPVRRKDRIIAFTEFTRNRERLEREIVSQNLYFYNQGHDWLDPGIKYLSNF